MAFAMKMRFVDVIEDESFKNIYINGEKIGFEFDIRLGYYRGHFLSCIDLLELSIDSKQIPIDQIKFCVNEKEFELYQLKELYSEFWSLLEPATIKVFNGSGLENKEYNVDFSLMLRVPYMSLGPNKYMPLDSGEQKVIKINE